MVRLDSPFVTERVEKALRSRPHIRLVERDEGDHQPDLQFVEYEFVDWDAVLAGTERSDCSCYCVRKGLTRKAAWAQVVNKWCDRFGRKNTPLGEFVPESVCVSTWDMFSDDGGWLGKFGVRDKKLAMAEALQDAQDLINDTKEREPTAKFILKPSISRKGAEVITVKDMEDVKRVVLEWPDCREWVLQRYVPNLLLLNGNRKFHMRVFIVAVGALTVHVFKQYIGFFALNDFDADDEFSHITNAAHQRDNPAFNEELAFKLPSELAELACEKLNMTKAQALFEFTDPEGKVLRNLNKVIAEAFRALKTQTAAFQPHPNCFELFGLDFLLDCNLDTHLLEFNSGPDLDQASENRLTPLIDELIEGWVHLGVDRAEQDERFVKCYEEKWAFAQAGTQTLMN